MRFTAHTEAGQASGVNEDWVSCSPGLVVVLDGVSARTDTGCRHGVTWYATHLGSALALLASDPATSLPDALDAAIQQVADKHPECDLQHPATPSAAVAVLRTFDPVEYLVLADITIVLDLKGQVSPIVDDRVSETATRQRHEADRHAIGSPDKQAALLHMKHAELAARNQSGGYWVAAADPKAAHHAITGTAPLDDLRRAAVFTDGAARLVDLFGVIDWPGALDLLGHVGPAGVVHQIRELEDQDPAGRQWPRNKRSDDATIVFAS